MSNTSNLQLDGRYLYYTFLAGGNRVLQHQAEINLINVFPVKDQDTGTNLASTIRAVIDNISPNKSYITTVNNIADAALIGARGNSGIIFAQFLYGLSKETKNKAAVGFHEFAESIKGSIPYIYEAISNPVEGTMLSVIKDWSDYINDQKNNLKDFRNVIIDSFITLEKSLEETTSKLEVLRKNNVVDAGAKGFVLFIEGVIDFLNDNNIRDFISVKNDDISIVHSEDIINEEIIHRYCTEAIIKKLVSDKSTIKTLLNNDGDSVVVAGSNETCRIHVHTNNPSELFHVLKDHGTITYQKVDDMTHQQEITTNRKWKIAIVTDSSCDLSQELLDQYQINVVPININFGDNHFLDKVTIKPERFYDLLESSSVFPTTSQINESSFSNIYSHLASHYDAIIGLHLTDKFSGTYNSSKKAANRISKEFNKPIVVFDSKTLSGALGLLVLKVARAIESGMSYESILENLEEWQSNSKIFVSVKTLKYMVKGGRVSPQKGFIANLLGVNPIVSMDENGNSLLMGKAFSQLANINKVIKHISKISQDKSITDYIVLHAHNSEAANIYVKKMQKITGRKPVSVVNISPVIGMNAGIGTAAVALLIE